LSFWDWVRSYVGVTGRRLRLIVFGVLGDLGGKGPHNFDTIKKGQRRGEEENKKASVRRVSMWDSYGRPEKTGQGDILSNGIGGTESK